jgi:hypothetical protein
VQDALNSSHPATTSVATHFTTGVRPAGRAASLSTMNGRTRHQARPPCCMKLALSYSPFFLERPLRARSYL